MYFRLTGNRAGKKIQKVSYSNFLCWGGIYFKCCMESNLHLLMQVKGLKWSEVCVWPLHICPCFQTAELTPCSDSGRNQVIHLDAGKASSAQHWEYFATPFLEALLQDYDWEMFRNVWADKVFKICFIAKIESNATNLFCQTETGHGCRWKRNSTNSSLLLRRIAWVPALSSGGHQHTQNPLWGENVGYQIGLDFISAKGIQTSVCKGKL